LRVVARRAAVREAKQFAAQAIEVRRPRARGRPLHGCRIRPSAEVSPATP